MSGCIYFRLVQICEGKSDLYISIYTFNVLHVVVVLSIGLLI
jgi:hypothetical protein